MAVGNPLLKLLGICPQIIQAPGISSPAMAAAVIAAGALGSIGVGGNRPGCFVRFREVDCDTPVTDNGEGFRMPAIAGGASGRGAAYGNRPCTNPRAASTVSMGI